MDSTMVVIQPDRAVRLPDDYSVLPDRVVLFPDDSLVCLALGRVVLLPDDDFA